jgi:hypothetical protein
MPLFRKPNRNSIEDDPIRAFWAWWAERRPAVEEAIYARQLPHGLVEELSTKVRAMDPALVWEVGPAGRSRYQLCVSPDGDISRRALTESWVRLAPTDPQWDYYPARQPTPDASTLKIGNHSFDAGSLRLATVVDAGRERVDLKVWHPLFA